MLMKLSENVPYIYGHRVTMRKNNDVLITLRGDNGEFASVILSASEAAGLASELAYLVEDIKTYEML